MAGIGEDGTTTVQKLEGFQIDPIPEDRISRCQSNEAAGYRTLIMSEIRWGDNGHILENREGVAI
jgi:hypothetical protein